MGIIPKITTNFEEYKKLSGSGLQKPTSTAKGYYYQGVIWVKELKFTVILHELIHHILNEILGNWSGGARLIFDLIDDIQDLFYHNIKYGGCRTVEAKQIIIKILKEDIQDIKTWYNKY